MTETEKRVLECYSRPGLRQGELTPAQRREHLLNLRVWTKADEDHWRQTGEILEVRERNLV